MSNCYGILPAWGFGSNPAGKILEFKNSGSGELLLLCPVGPRLLHGGAAVGDPSTKPLSEICIQILDKRQPSSNFCRCFDG
jgi:hypothetical protein